MPPEERPQRRRLLLRAVIGLAVTGSLVCFLLRYVDLRQIGGMLAGMDRGLCLAGFALWVALYFVRTVRFVLLSPRTPFWTMFCVAAVHNFLLRSMPMRTGELSYAFLLRRAGTAGLGESLLSLVLVRLLDATTVVILFAVALVVDRGAYRQDRQTGLWMAGVGVLVCLALLAGLRPAVRLAQRALGRVLRATGLDRRSSFETLARHAERTVESFSSIRFPVILQCSAISVAGWLLTYATFFAIMRAFSVPVGGVQTVLGATTGVVTSFLPIGGIGSFGTLEAGWAAGFMLVGLERSVAVASGFGNSIVTYGYAGVLGAIGWILLEAIGRKKKSQS